MNNKPLRILFDTSLYVSRLAGKGHIVSIGYHPTSNKFALHMASKDSGDEYYKGMDAYQILEVPRDADKKTIKAAYRKGSCCIKNFRCFVGWRQTNQRPSMS